MSPVASTYRTTPGFFYLDRDDTRRRAALLMLALEAKSPRAKSFGVSFARALAKIGKASLNTTGKPRIATEGSMFQLARLRGMIDDSVKPSSYGIEARVLARRSVQHALIFLGLQHPPLSELCDLLITDILVWPSDQSGGGSISSLPGVAWLVPADRLTTLDIAESVIHEMVHMNLHLADMTVGLYTRLPGTDFEAYSAVRGRRRRYHHAFHSACVAVTILYYRMLLGLGDDLSALRESLHRCTAELMGHPDAFTRYAWCAIRAAHAFSRAPRLSAIPVHRDLMTLSRTRSRQQASGS